MEGGCEASPCGRDCRGEHPGRRLCPGEPVVSVSARGRLAFGRRRVFHGWRRQELQRHVHEAVAAGEGALALPGPCRDVRHPGAAVRSEEHTSELQSRSDLVCRLLLEKKKKNRIYNIYIKKKKKRNNKK